MTTKQTKARKAAAANSLTACRKAIAATAPLVLIAARNGTKANEAVKVAVANIAKVTGHGTAAFNQAQYTTLLAALRDTAKSAHIAAKVQGNKSDDAALEMARGIMGKLNPDAKGKGAKRSVAEQQAYIAAGVYWSRLVKDCNVPAAKPSNGRDSAARKTAAKKKFEAAVEQAVKAAKVQGKLPAAAAKFVPPAKADKAAFVAYVTGLSAALLTKCEATNQSLMSSKCETLPIGITTAIADFKAAIDKAMKTIG